jgi:prolyl-tRNA synthetase
MAKADIGEDELIVCNCGYGANTEKAECVFEEIVQEEIKKQKELVNTPSVKTIEELVSYLKVSSDKFIKAVVYNCDKGIAIALVKGDREIEEVKLKNNLGVENLEFATPEQIESIGSVAGFVGALNLRNVIIVADNDIKNMVNFVIGANKTDYHYINANIEDLTIDYYADIKKAQAGDRCPRCGDSVRVVRGIEVGHIFKLGTKYSKALECKYLDEQGKEQYMIMGCYGIGVSRTLSAIVEQNCDEKGIIWPESIAPYKLEIIIANNKDESQLKLANELYEKINKSGNVLFDDRNERIGVKLNDAELIGIPYLVVVGRGAVDNIIELTNRKTLEKIEITVEDFIDKFGSLI